VFQLGQKLEHLLFFEYHGMQSLLLAAVRHCQNTPNGTKSPIAL